MTGAEVAQILTALATFVASTGAVVIGLRNTRQIKQVHDATNGLVAKLGDAREEKGHYEGRAEAIAERDPDA